MDVSLFMTIPSRSMYRFESSGPRIEPCGAPKKILLSADLTLPTKQSGAQNMVPNVA